MFEGSRGISAPQQVYDKDGKPVHFNSSDEYNAWASANPELADPDTQKTLKTKATANLLYGPEPTMPGYNDHGTTAGIQGTNLDMTGLDAFKKEALRKGPSAWAGLMNQNEDLQAATQRDRGARESDAAAAQGRSALAMHGGLTAGARERGALMAGKNYLDMSQQIGRQTGLNKLQVGINDEQNRIQQLSMVPGMDLGVANFGLNKNKALLDASNAENTFNMEGYKNKMAGYGANRAADAAEKNHK
jgi:hypothetical protein